ncbi:MAG: hypothetical protein AAFY29_02810 [Pseudomonadota bacterium]
MDDKESDSDKQPQRQEPTDHENILMALDQISQTIDVMTSVVGRLRSYVEEQEVTQDTEIREAMRPGRILH